MAGMVLRGRGQPTAVLATLHPDGRRENPRVKPPPCATADVKAADAEMCSMRKDYLRGLEKKPAWKVLHAAGQTAGLTSGVQELQLEVPARLCLTCICGGSPQGVADLLGRPEPDALVYQVLGGLLPEQLLQQDASGVPYYVHHLVLYTADVGDLPGLYAFSQAAAKYYLLRPDFFGGLNNPNWLKAQSVLQHFLTNLNAAAAPQCAVPPQLLGDPWPPAPSMQLRGFQHKTWAEAQPHMAAAAAGTAAGGGAAAKAKATAAAAAQLAKGDAPAAAGSEDNGVKQKQRPAARKPAVPKAVAAQAAAAPRGRQPRKELKPDDEVNGMKLQDTLLWTLSRTVRSSDIKYITSLNMRLERFVPKELRDAARRQPLQIQHAAHCIGPLEDQAFLQEVLSLLHPPEQLLESAEALRAALLSGKEGPLLPEQWPGGAGSTAAEVLDAVKQAMEQAGEGSCERATFSALAELLEERAGVDQQGWLEHLLWVPESWKPVIPSTAGYTVLPRVDSYDSSGSDSEHGSEGGCDGNGEGDSNSSHGDSNSRGTGSSSSSNYDSKPPVLTQGMSRQLLKLGSGLGVVAQLLGKPILHMTDLEPCHDVADTDYLLGAPHSFKLKQDPTGAPCQLKLYHVQTLDLQGNYTPHETADRNWAVSDRTGRPAWSSQVLVNELLAAGDAARQDDNLFLGHGYTICMQHLAGGAGGGLSEEQLQEWRGRHELGEEEVLQALPEGGLVAVYVCQVVPYRGKDLMTIKAELCTSAQFLALNLEEKQELLASASCLLIVKHAEVMLALSNTGVMDADEAGADVAIQSSMPRSGPPLKDLMQDIAYGSGAVVYHGINFNHHLLPAEDEAITPDDWDLHCRRRKPHHCGVNEMVECIYPQALMQQRAAAAAAAKQTLLDVDSREPVERQSSSFLLAPPRLAIGGYIPNHDEERIGRLYGLWGDLVMCLPAQLLGGVLHEEGSLLRFYHPDLQEVLVWRLRDWPDMPKAELRHGCCCVDNISVAKAAAAAVERSTSGCPVLGKEIRDGMTRTPSVYQHTLQGVLDWCSNDYEADIQVVERYIARWFGKPAKQ